MMQATKILVVDDDAAHSTRLVSEAASRPDIAEVVVAGTANAVDTLARQPVDGVVLDLDLEEDFKAHLVGEIERLHPGMPLVATAVRIDNDKVAAACHLGAVAVVAKPVQLAGLLQLLRTPAADAGFSGSCTGIPTAHLLSLHRAAAHDGVLYLHCEETGSRPERHGSLFLEGGQPVHAVAGSLVGAEAVHAMLSWPDAEATWIAGTTRCARTIVGRWEGLLAGAGRGGDDQEDLDRIVAIAYPEVVEKLARLAQTPDVLGAFLLRHAEVVAGRCVAALDEQVAGRALCRLAHVFFDVEAQPVSGTSGEAQAVIGDVRLVLDRIGPAGAGFQVGVVVRQAAPVCKSLRRLLRQIDSAFDRATPRGQRPGDRGRSRDSDRALANA